MTARAVQASIEVAVDPQTAFRIFTEEIDAWWERGPINFYDGARAVAKRFEPGVGGRYLEIYDDAAGDALEIGRITVWEPGRRLVYRSSLDDTEVDVRFEAIPGGTRVALEQRIVPGGVTAHFLSGWHNILAWFAERADAAQRPTNFSLSPLKQSSSQSPRTSAARDLPRICPVLHYRDPGAAEEWLVRVFGLRRRHRGERVGELVVGDSLVMLRGLELTNSGGGEGAPDGDGAPRMITHSLYVYVDDLHEHFARAQSGGATILNEIHKCGDRSYAAEDLEGRRWTFAQARPTQP